MRALLAVLALAVSAYAADLDHSAWEELLKQYVTPDSRVDYAKWKQEGPGRLDAYLKTLAAKWPETMPVSSRKAALINAYNALTIRWVLENYPVDSIWRTKHAFGEARHMVDGEKVSLEEIQMRLRNLGDPRIHGALVSASRSDPPLRREAYVGLRVGDQLDENVRSWLANPKLNRFDPEKKIATVSEIFDRFGSDFITAPGSLNQFLSRYAPAGQGAFLLKQGALIKYAPYNWGLNDSSGLGDRYRKTSFLWDYTRNK